MRPAQPRRALAMRRTLNTFRSDTLGVVIIGRTEGERLAGCLASVRAVPNRVYVDSGSTDSSVAFARRDSVRVVELSQPPHSTAARARNAGLAQLLNDVPGLGFVQMVDGDCDVQAGSMESGLRTLHAESKLVLVFGRTRERNPDLSIYKALCDDEWNVPIRDATDIGGNASLTHIFLSAPPAPRTLSSAIDPTWTADTAIRSPRKVPACGRT